jgi:hypothetical protein
MRRTRRRRMRAESESLLVNSDDSPSDETEEAGSIEIIVATEVLSSCYKNLTRRLVRVGLRKISRVPLEEYGR